MKVVEFGIQLLVSLALNVRRLGIQLLVSLALLSLAGVLFSIMKLNQSYYQGKTPSISQQIPGSGPQISTPPSRKHFDNVTLNVNVPHQLSNPPSRKHSDNVTLNMKVPHQISNPPSRKHVDMVPSNLKLPQTKQGANVSKINEKDHNMTRTRYLIYLCDKQRKCGGWGDRQKGFVSTSVLAIVTGRTFGINMSVPCDIKLFYIPNQISWYIRTPDIRGLSWQVVAWMNKASVADFESDFNRLYSSDVVFLKTNLDLIERISKSPRYGHLVPAEYRNMTTAFANGWHKLMKPTFHLEEHLDMFMSNIPDNGDLVCAHIRLRKNPTIPNDEALMNSFSSVGQLWKFLLKYERNASRIFIASDSIDIRKSARKHLGRKELDTNGLVLHIDRQGGWNNACVGFEMAVLEQAILTKCKVLVMSRSGFSVRAAMMSSIKQKLFAFRNGTILQLSRLSLNLFSV